ncbi:hypothetical protein ACR6C2_34405 [Streptomyces sp. INA 01156]
MNDDSTAVAEPELAEPYLRQILDTAGLAVEYVRAEGTRCTCAATTAPSSRSWTSPADTARCFSATTTRKSPHTPGTCSPNTPVHAQFSRHPYANRLAAELNRIIARELSDDEPYYAIFGNSGAESVEAAVKHAELDRAYGSPHCSTRSRPKSTRRAPPSRKRSPPSTARRPHASGPPRGRRQRCLPPSGGGDQAPQQ